jgi:hypothetical protein
MASSKESQTELPAATDTARRLRIALALVVGGMLLISFVCRALGQPHTTHEIRSLLLLSTTNDSWFYMWKTIAWWELHPDGDIYQELFFNQHLQFLYPLTSLLPMLGLHALGLDTHRALTLLNFTLFLGCIAVLARMGRTLALSAGLIQLRTREDLMVRVLGVCGAICFYPLLKAFTLGQIQVWLDFAYFAACLCYLRGWNTAAGCLMGFSALIKPQMLMFLPWALLRKDRRFVAGWLTVAVGGALIALSLFNPAQLLSYAKVLTFLSDHGEAFFSNQSFNGAALRFLHDPSNLVWSDTTYPPYHFGVAMVTRISGVLAVSLGLFWKWRDPVRYGFNSFVVAAICFTLASPLAWEQHYGVLLPGFLLAYVSLLRRPGPIPAAPGVLLALTYLVCGNVLSPLNATADTSFNLLQSYLLLGALSLTAQLIFLSKPYAAATGMRSSSDIATAPEAVS